MGVRVRRIKDISRVRVRFDIFPQPILKQANRYNSKRLQTPWPSSVQTAVLVPMH